MNDQFSDDLKKAIEESFVLIDQANRIAIVGANVSGLADTSRKNSCSTAQGLRAELTMRHGYVVIN